MKRCSKCKANFDPKTHFQKNCSTKDGYDHYCRTCKKTESAGRRERRKNQGKCHCGNRLQSSYETCAVCRNRRQVWGDKNPEIVRENNKAWRTKYKNLVFDRYGRSCACCGLTIPEFLTIDHIDGGGTRHRRLIGWGVNFYYWLVKQGLPDGYRTFCMNCNWSYGQYGYCPHQKGVDTPLDLAVVLGVES